MNLALLRLVDDADRDEFHRITCRNAGEQQLRLDFKMSRAQLNLRPCVQVHQPEAALAVGQGASSQARKPAAHPAVHLAAQPGHVTRFIHAVADDERGARLLGASQEGRNVPGRMLSVAIHGHGPAKAKLTGASPAGMQRGTFALRRGVAHHLRPRPRRQLPRGVGGAVIHHDDGGQLFADLSNERFDGRRFVQAGDHCGALRGPVHFDGVPDMRVE